MSNISRYIVGAIITAVVVFLLWYFSDIVIYILVSAILAILGKPMVDWLSGLHIRKSRLRIPRWLAALTTLLTIWLVLIGVFSIFLPIVFQTAKQFSSLDVSLLFDSFREPIEAAEQLVEQAFSLPQGEFSLVESLSMQIRPLLNLNLINNLLSSLVGTLATVMVAAFSISFITFFFLKENHLFAEMVTILFPKRYEENITRALTSITNLLMRYFTGILFDSSMMTLIVSVGLLIMGFSWSTALMIALIVGVLNVIPYLGPLISAGIGIVIGILNGGPDISLAWIVVRIASVILTAQLIDNVVLQPMLYSKQAKAHPLEIFLVILIAGSLAGVLGMLLAIPAYNVIRVFAKEFFNNFRVVQKLTEKI